MLDNQVDSMKISTEKLDNIIFGRVDPKIYAFTTGTIPNYLKVGDTYRPIEKRLDEWRNYFPDLKKHFDDIAKVDDETFFRDHAIHFFLEHEAEKQKLKKGEIEDIPYYSQEFFKDTTNKDIETAIKDIKNSYTKNQNKYQYYKFEESRVPETYTYTKLSEDYKLRPNQDKTVRKFKKAVDSDRSNLLMYAVMRFGKSFTSMSCAVEIKANIVLVVSAKADVKTEWKKTVEESPKKFSEYVFLENKDLLESETVIKNKQEEGRKIVIFLTLQDLQGSKIKQKHKEIFKEKIDLLIIDETHFGARAEEYGRVLLGKNLINKKDLKQELKLNEESLDELNKEVKTLNSKVRLHLSGTPYRILMGSEFEDDDIIAFYQFSDIAEDQKKWDEEYLNNDEVKEWDNPYYGFPQMVRFAFNPNESSRKKMEELKSNGISYTLSALLKPQSITKDTDNLYKKFIHEPEVLDLFKVIDGSKSDENILNFLDYKKIKEGKMCRHIVCVLPYRASCDALETLLKNSKFKNLSEYEIINISGVDGDKKYKTTQLIQSKIKDFEFKNKKTITLTVNRMLTGSTVPEWDTMLYFKDTASPQEYDQAVFRLQNQYIRNYIEPNGDKVKFNMKPQTLLVDFHPNRMFEVQEQKALIYNVNTDRKGGVDLKKQIQRELNVSPIIVLNKNKIQEITPVDILDAVRNYSKDRGVDDEARSIPIDVDLLKVPEIRDEIERQNEIGSKQGLEITSAQGEGDDLDINEKIDKEAGGEKIAENVSSLDKEAEEDFRKRFAAYYMRILFFAFLTDSQIESVQDIIQVIKNNKNNQRVIKNLGINTSVLKLFQKHINPFTVAELDRKIHNINSLANDKNIQQEERAKIAMKKITRLSESEVVTPEFIADKMINTLPEKEINSSSKILDIASKQGEFVYAIFKKFGKKVANNVYSIPTSKAAYEFTRKTYESLGLNIDNIEKEYTSYQLIEDNKIINGKNVKINSTNMKFDVIVGNPPYQISDGGAQASAKPIYNEFVNIAKRLDPSYISIIMPTRWYAGGKGLDDFRGEMLNDEHIKELHDFLKPDLVFKDVNLRGGVCYFVWDKNFDNRKKLTKVMTYRDNLEPDINTRSLKIKGAEIFIRHGIAVDILDKVRKNSKFEAFENYVSSRKPFGFEANIVKNKKLFRSSKNNLKNPIVCYGKNKKIGYIDRSEINKNLDLVDIYKVFTPRANNIGTELNDDNFNTFVGAPKTISTESYIALGVDLNLNKISSENICKYFSTKFARFMHGISKASHDASSKTYGFVPLQDFTLKSDIDWSNSISEINKQLYKKYKLTKEEINFIDRMIKPM
jgi:hypothetical protein